MRWLYLKYFHCRTSLKTLGALAMLCLFLWQASVAVDKYQSGLTSLQERLEDSGTLLYPSITFCAKYIWEGFPGVMELLNNNQSLQFNDIKNFALTNYWSREKVFSFVSHQNVLKNKSFPCNTVGGSQTGKPCSFPFIYQSIVDQSWDNVTETETESGESNKTFLKFSSCTPLDDVTPWCYTRVYRNLTYILGQWGYCPDHCQGETPTEDSSYNLAREDHLWEMGLYDLSTWGSGICHTYNPPAAVEPGVTGQFYSLLGQREKLFAPMRFLGFNIYIHDAGRNLSVSVRSMLICRPVLAGSGNGQDRSE